MTTQKETYSADHRPATPGAFEVFWRNYSSKGRGVGDGFDRCCHAHLTLEAAYQCRHDLSESLYDRPLSAERGVFVARTRIHPGGPWHEAGEVVPDESDVADPRIDLRWQILVRPPLRKR